MQPIKFFVYEKLYFKKKWSEEKSFGFFLIGSLMALHKKCK
jgi:hypothetical protein